MKPYIVLAVLVLFCIYTGGVYYKGRYDESMVAVTRERDGLIAYANEVKKGVEQNDKDKITIANLRNDVSKLRNSVRFPICSKDSDEAGRVLSDRVDALFGELQERVGRLAEEADQLNADAIRANTLNK